MQNLPKCDFNNSGCLLSQQELRRGSSVALWCSGDWCFMSFSTVILGVTGMLWADVCSTPNIMSLNDSVSTWEGRSGQARFPWTSQCYCRQPGPKTPQEIHTCSFQSMWFWRKWISLFSSKEVNDYSRMGSLAQPWDVGSLGKMSYVL